MKTVSLDDTGVELREALRNHPLTQEIPDGVHANLLDGFRLVTLQPGETLLHQLEEASTCYLLLSGSLEAWVGDRQRARLVGTLSPGVLVGEMGALTNQLRSATIRATADSQVIEIPGRNLSQLLRLSGTASSYVLNLLGARLAATDKIFDELSRKPELSTPLPKALFSQLYQRLIGSRLHRPEFLGLASFALVAMVTRLLGEAVPALQGSALFLKGTYLSGFAIFFLSALALFIRFQHHLVRWVAVGLGVGAGLVVNNLSLLIAFDIFYPEVGTVKQAANFSYAMLYRRSESLYALLGVPSLLVFLTYFHGVFRVMWLLLKGLVRRRG